MSSNQHRAITRPWVETDAPVVAALLSDIWGPDPPPRFTVHGPPSDAPGAFGRTLVAERDGHAIGVGTVQESWLHPARWRLAIHVRPEHRRQGIGSALLADLVAATAGHAPRPLQAATSADDHAGRRFLDRHGFRPLMRTRLGTLDPLTLPSSAWREIDTATARTTAAGYRLFAMPDLPPRLAWERSIAALHAEVYRLGHAWNPPAPLAEDQTRRLFLDPDDLIPEALYVAVTEDRPVAVASLRLAASPTEFELGWVGTSADRHAHEADLVAVLVGMCLRHAAAHRRPIRLEIDEAAQSLWKLAEPWPVAWEPDWLTFVRGNRGQPDR